MTAASSTLRRRKSTMGGIPKPVSEWFSGEPRQPGQSRFPWVAMAFPGWALLPGWWRTWKAEHPKAAPPAGFEWLADDGDARNHPPSFVMRSARRSAVEG
ncbi:MAG: hypothetical protein KGL43_24075 [Burkholderiales bacterium]|nr:hypothetical protein [Burkholderiales bacterium]